MYSKGHYKRHKIGSTVSNLIFRIIMLIAGVCLVWGLIWTVGRCFTHVNKEMDERQYVP